MAIPLYLAMTEEEFSAADPLPAEIAWMACHFSSYGTGLTNLPAALPPNALLILNDRVPASGHDPSRVCKELKEIAQVNQCAGVLLDFQRPNCEETARIVKEALRLPFPVIVSDCYAAGLDCPVFLPPPPLLTSLNEYLAPWASRTVWLEAALSHARITVTPEGSSMQDMPPEQAIDDFREDFLHCHYSIRMDDNQIIFSLQRSYDDLLNLLQQGESLGISAAVGLYQELQQRKK